MHKKKKEYIGEQSARDGVTKDCFLKTSPELCGHYEVA